MAIFTKILVLLTFLDYVAVDCLGLFEAHSTKVGPYWFCDWHVGVFFIYSVKLFFSSKLPKLFNSNSKRVFSWFLRFFIITPFENGRLFGKVAFTRFVKQMGSTMGIVKNFFYIRLYNFFKTIKLPKFLIWRPLIKKISYYGLYIQSRINFFKNFKD